MSENVGPALPDGGHGATVRQSRTYKVMLDTEMPNFKRYFVKGGTYFFTVVTDGRRKIFEQESARTLLGNITRTCLGKWPFKIEAVVLLPDHLHSIWTLPDGDDAYPRRWGWLKKEFTKAWLGEGNRSRPVSGGRARDGRSGVWQPKYWEHLIRDEVDFERLADYVHYNPVKHGYVKSPSEWKWSSFRRFVREGLYQQDWGSVEMMDRFEPILDCVGE